MRESGHERLIGRIIAGKFVVEELLGAGAMGAVFRARQVALEKTVAIKVLHGEHAHDATFAARFHREAKAASRLNHPNSMQVIDFGAEPDGLLYIAMEYLDGRSLHRLLRDEWPLSASRIADILMQTLAALAVAHDMGVLHRDLKPENIMVLQGTDDDGRPRDIVKVCDFGIAKITDPRAYRGNGERESNAPVTTAGFLVGTPEYMSPEQGRGEKLDPRSDLYSVGIILFEMLVCRVPFQAENAIGVVLKHITEVPCRPSELVLGGVDRRLEAICLRALRKVSHERYASAREMRAELRAVGGSPSGVDHALAAAAGSLGGLAPAIAPTVQAASVAYAGSSDDASAKPTLLGTTTTIPGSPRRRAFVIGAAALVTGGVIATALGMASRQLAHRSQASTRPSAAHPVPILSLVAPESVLAPTPPPEPSSSTTRAGEPPAVTPRATAHTKAPGGGPAARGLPTSGPSSPNALPPVAAPSAPPPAATAFSSPPAASINQAPAAAEGTSTGRAVSLPTLADAPDPTFDPERGYVEIGLVNAQGAREAAVRGALRGVGLARCYRGALRARGGRASGTATLNLSFDETGFARSAIVTGGDFLPGLAGCLQTASAGARIPRSHVDPGGGTAEVVLAFKVP